MNIPSFLPAFGIENHHLPGKKTLSGYSSHRYIHTLALSQGYRLLDWKERGGSSDPSFAERRVRHAHTRRQFGGEPSAETVHNAGPRYFDYSSRREELRRQIRKVVGEDTRRLAQHPARALICLVVGIECSAVYRRHRVL